MMNTNEKKHDNNTNQKKENTFKLCTWKKKWVRPYESIYSILRNFCKINVFQGSYAMKVLGAEGYSTMLPVPKIMMFVKSKQNEHNYHNLCNTLLPDWYTEQINPITSLDIHTFSNVVKSTISYCPECAKENYHSFLFQFYHIKQCPFHRISLIDTPYYYTPQDSITYGKSEKFIDVRYDILPCERQLANDYYMNKMNAHLRYIIPISSVNEKHGVFFHIHQVFYSENNASHMFQVTKSELDITEMNSKFKKWFDKQNIPVNLYDPKFIWKISNGFLQIIYPPFLTSYLDYLLYYLFYDFTKEYDLSSEESSKKIDEVFIGERVLSSDEIFELKISYLWAIISCSHPSGSLSNTWIVRPYSTDSKNTRNIYNGVHLSDLGRNDISYNTHISEVDSIIIMMKILSDLFKSVWKQLLAITKKNGQFNAFNDWKLIHVPEYYICINDDTDNLYTILRYDNTLE